MPVRQDHHEPLNVALAESFTPEGQRRAEETALASLKSEEQRTFIRGLLDGLNLSEACQRAGISRTTQVIWRKDPTDTAFQTAYTLAQAIKCDRIEQEIHRRAVEGIDVPVYQQGKLIGHRRDYSDLLLIFQAKAEMPQKYRDNVHVTGEVRMPVSFRHERDPDDPALKTVEGVVVSEGQEK